MLVPQGYELDDRPKDRGEAADKPTNARGKAQKDQRRESRAERPATTAGHFASRAKAIFTGDDGPARVALRCVG